MRVELDKADIILEIKENHANDVDFIVEIIDKTTSTWESVRDITMKLIEMLSKNDELADLYNRINQQNENTN